MKSNHTRESNVSMVYRRSLCGSSSSNLSPSAPLPFRSAIVVLHNIRLPTLSHAPGDICVHILQSESQTTKNCLILPLSRRREKTKRLLRLSSCRELRIHITYNEVDSSGRFLWTGRDTDTEKPSLSRVSSYFNSP